MTAATFTGVVPGAKTGRLSLPRRPSTGRLRRLAELLALTAFAFAQPVLDVTGRSPDFFLYRRATPGQLRLLILIVVAGPPLALWLVEEAVGLVARGATRAVHLAFCALLFTAVTIEVGKHSGIATGAALFVVAAVAGAGLAVLQAARPGFRQAVRYAAPAPLVFALLFALVSPAGALVRPVRGDPQVRAVAAKRPPIVFVILDEFPLRTLLKDDGTIDAGLFPNFARLARTSTWYPNATGVSGWTPYAVPAVLTGRYPRRAVAPSYVNHPGNLFTLLRRSYEMQAFESVAQLCPPAQCGDATVGRDTGLGALVKDTAGVAGEILSPYVTAAHEGAEFAEVADKTDPTFRFDQMSVDQPSRFTSFVEGLRPTERPTVHFLHLLLPHAPHLRLPDGTRYEGTDMRAYDPKAEPRVLAEDRNVGVVRWQRLLLQTAYTDMLLGRMLDRMQQTGLLDEATVVVTADHGEGIAPLAHWRRLDDRSAADLAWVPLFVKSTNQRAGVVDRRNGEAVDIVPTVADLLDVDVPWRVDGRSLLGSPRDAATKHWYDVPGEPRTIETAKFRKKVATGIAPRTGRPSLGIHGLYAVGCVERLYGVAVDSLPIGAPAAVTATLAPHLDFEHVSLQAPPLVLLRGALSREIGRRADDVSRWIAVSINGTIAGAVTAAQYAGDSRWRFLGLVDHRYYREGRNDVRFWTVEDGVLHPVSLR